MYQPRPPRLAAALTIGLFVALIILTAFFSITVTRQMRRDLSPPLMVFDVSPSPMPDPTPSHSPPQEKARVAPVPLVTTTASMPKIPTAAPPSAPTPVPAPAVAIPTVPAPVLAPAAGPVGAGPSAPVATKGGGARCTIPQPPYPASARRLKKEGSVTVRLTFGPDGKVSDAAIAQRSGFGAFDAAAMEAVRQARCTGAERDGQTALVPINFSLDR